MGYDEIPIYYMPHVYDKLYAYSAAKHFPMHKRHICYTE